MSAHLLQAVIVQALIVTGLAWSLGGCSAGPLKDGRSAFSPGGADVRVPMASLSERRFTAVVRQQYDFSCGSAALATLLTYHYGDPQPEPAVFLGMWREGDRIQIQKAGFSLLDMKRYLKERGFDGNGYRVSLDQIAKTGLPGIAMIETKGYRHFVAVKGVYAGQVLVGDPAFGVRLIPAEEFAAAWNGIYFVVEKDGHKPAFNAASDWRVVNRARYVGAMDLESLQAAALFRLGFGEF